MSENGVGVDDSAGQVLPAGGTSILMAPGLARDRYDPERPRGPVRELATRSGAGHHTDLTHWLE